MDSVDSEREERPPGGLPEGGGSSEETYYKTSDPRPHLMEFDSLRGIGILMVVMAHAGIVWRWTIGNDLPVPLLRIDLLDFFRMGYLAIPLFFLLSGYLLTWTEEGRKRRGSYSVLNYAKRRVLRIIPAYYVAIVVVILVWPSHPSFGAVALHLTLLHGFKPSYPVGLDGAWWSLTPELVFYAMLPLLVLKFRKFWQRATILGILLLVSLVTRLSMAYGVFSFLPVLNGFSGNRLYFFPTTLLYLCFVGVLLRMIVERYTKADHELSRQQLFLASALTVVPIALLLVFNFLIMRPGPHRDNPVGLFAEAMLILAFASVLLGSPILKPVLKLRPLVFLGEMSYSFFLLHNTIILMVFAPILAVTAPWLADQSELTMWATFFAYASGILAVAGGLAYLSYRYIESPFMRIKPK
ncbi:MAG: acyltransferase [Actinomycetota bacterium]|nr:acyltransferase [Actinomycetota bacterium]